jgi:threonine/homoserine/homoserine lactone efflux protein
MIHRRVTGSAHRRNRLSFWIIPRVHVAPFVAVAFVIVLTPGVDMALVTRNALRHGRQAALLTAAGINLGIALWTGAAALGIAALVATSARLFDVVKLAGVVYLVYLGVQTIRHRGRALDLGAGDLTPRRALGQGLVSNLLNPKIAVFFTSLLPQFVDGSSHALVALLILGAIFNSIGVAWLTIYALLVARSRTFFLRPRIRSAFDTLSGVILVGLGVRLAFERRP